MPRLIHFKQGKSYETLENLFLSHACPLMFLIVFQILGAWTACGGGKRDVAETETVSSGHRVT